MTKKKTTVVNNKRMPLKDRTPTAKTRPPGIGGRAEALGDMPTAPSGLELTVGEVSVLMNAALQFPQARGSKDYHTMNGAITKLQAFMMQSMPQGATGMPPPA